MPIAMVQDASEEVAADAQQHLSRPLVIDLPSSLAAGSWGGDDEGLDDVPAYVRSASWRLAAGANNLAPWRWHRRRARRTCRTTSRASRTAPTSSLLPGSTLPTRAPRLCPRGGAATCMAATMDGRHGERGERG